MGPDDSVMPIRSAVCPFCELHCDDVVWDTQGDVAVDCPRAQRMWADSSQPSPPRIGDQSATLHQVIDWWIDGSHADDPIEIEVHGSDVNLAKSLMRWHLKRNIRVSVPVTATGRAMGHAMIRDGGYLATLADIRAHADVLWMLGDCDRYWPRLSTRLIRDIDPPRVFQQIGRATSIELARIALAMRQGPAAAGDPTPPAGAPDAFAAMADQLVAAMRQAHSIAIVIAPDALEPADAGLSADLLTDLIRHRNRTHRATLVRLDPNASLRSVALWTTGHQIAATGVGDAAQPEPGVDAASSATRRRIRIVTATGVIHCDDAGHWSADRKGTGPAFDLQIGGDDPGPDVAAAYVRGGMVGLDHAGIVIRGDGTVTLPLVALRPTDTISIQRLLDLLLGIV